MKNLFAPLLVLLSIPAFAQDHGHLNIGAVGTNQNDQLTFDNAPIFETGTNYVKTLTFATSGAYAGYYQGNITLTGLATTTNHLGPDPNAAAPGSRLFAQLVSVDGPPGGAFAIWESGAASPTFSLTSGTTGTNTWRVSENDGSPGSDPYGHIHGRRFTATKPGIYIVGFRAFDFSTNGIGDGPIHTPSEVIKVFFQAGDCISQVESAGNQTLVTFGARFGFSWELQAATALNPSDWQTIGAPVPGDDYFHEVLDDMPAQTKRFYRLKGTAINP